MDKETEIIGSIGAVIITGIIRLIAFVIAIYFAIDGQWDKASFFLLVNLLFKISKKDYKEKVIDYCFYHKPLI